MAIRPVFVFNEGKFYDHHLDFKWHAGFSLEQKQKSISELHSVFETIYPNHDILEVSTSSPTPLGVALSAFNLTDTKGNTVETIFQSSKVFEKGGPYLDLLGMESVEAKKDPRLKDSGNLIGFNFEGVSYPTVPHTAFYNWIYINALLQHPDLVEQLNNYDAFSDIEFNPKKSINCQAEALAVYTALDCNSLLDTAMSSIETFISIVYGN